MRLLLTSTGFASRFSSKHGKLVAAKIEISHHYLPHCSQYLTTHPSLPFLLQQQKVIMLRSSLSAARAAARLQQTSNVGALRFMSAKEIKFGVDGRTAMLQGVETLADAVQVRKNSLFTRWRRTKMESFDAFRQVRQGSLKKQMVVVMTTTFSP